MSASRLAYSNSTWETSPDGKSHTYYCNYAANLCVHSYSPCNHPDQRIARHNLQSNTLIFPVHGVLGYLAIRYATKPHIRILTSALLTCISVSLCDEMLQWLHPERFFDVQDLLLNGLSSLFGTATRLLPLKRIWRGSQLNFL
ncbi:MAG: VanZ family protein [Bdellovibrionales bacterium]|nr:VanZ family protein [Bdellovibrionales bacterium]